MGNQPSVEFEEAAKKVEHLKPKPTDEQMLKLYALFKQATSGDNYRPEPTGMLDIKAKKKWEAWTELKGLAPDEAAKQYIAFVEELEKGSVQ